jgi:hypothetical protein
MDKIRAEARAAVEGRPLDTLEQQERDERTIDWVDANQDLPTVREMIDADSAAGSLVRADESVPAAIRKKVLVAELQGLVKYEVQLRFELGRRLSELQSLTHRGEFLRTLQSDLWGLSPTYAYQHIIFHRKCAAFPAIRDMAERNFTKAIALFSSLEDDQIEAFARGELTELPPDSLDEMSVSELKRELKKFKKDVGQIVKEETKGLVQERDALIKERDDALAQILKPDWKRSRDMAAELAKLAEKVTAQTAILLDSLPKDQPIPSDLSFGIETALYRTQTAAQTAWGRFAALKCNEE